MESPSTFENKSQNNASDAIPQIIITTDNCNYPLQADSAKPQISSKSGNSTAGSDRISFSNIPSKQSNAIIPVKPLIKKSETRQSNLRNSSFYAPTKSSMLKLNKKDQINASFRSEVNHSNSVGPWGFAFKQKHEKENIIARKSHLKAYDSYINESLAEMMNDLNNSRIMSTKNSMTSNRRNQLGNIKQQNSLVNRQELAAKLKEAMIQSTQNPQNNLEISIPGLETQKSPASILKEYSVSFSGKNEPAVSDKIKESFIAKGAQELKEDNSLSQIQKVCSNESNKQQSMNISGISKVEPSAFIENVSILKEMTQKNNTAHTNYNEGIDEYSYYEDIEENAAIHINEPCNTSILQRTHDSNNCSRKCETTLCSYDNVALVKNEEKISDYLTKLTKIEKKYKKMFDLLKEEKKISMQLVVKKCLDLNPDLTSRSNSQEICEKYQEMIDEYNRTKKLLKEQQLMENNEILAEYREFHKLLHK